MKKIITKADNIQHDIDRIKEILKEYDRRISSNDCNGEDLIELKRKKDFMQEQLQNHETLYGEYKETNELYYEPNTYEYFKDTFSRKENMDNLDYSFIYQVKALADDEETPSKKGKILNNIVKAYKEREKEF